MTAETVRQPAVAGAFYPGNADELQREVNAYIDEVESVDVGGEIVAALAPHAGYQFSAPVAAHVYRALRNVEADTVVIIGHDAHATGVVAILSDVDSFETPLGKVAVDTDLVEKLQRAHRGIIVHNQVHRREHTVEVHLPFLQTVMPGCKIVPVLFGEPSSEHCRAFAEALAEAGEGKNVFILASTDLSHYPSDSDAREVDGQTMNIVEKMDLRQLFEHLRTARTNGDRKNIQTAMCASGGVGTAILAAKARGATEVKILKQANSSDVPGGDESRVVGYAAALFIKPDTAADKTRESEQVAPAEDEFSLPEPVQKELLKLARDRIESVIEEEKLDYTPPEEYRDILEKDAAVFVTLHREARLRGCIGMTSARMPLWHAVYDMAFSAAFKDWRFPPVKAGELADLQIEISVLSPLREVASHREVVPHRHGVVVRQKDRSGIFLPQVWEQIPRKDRFLSVLCSEKAGLPGDAWKKEDTELLVFTVFAFEEE